MVPTGHPPDASCPKSGRNYPSTLPVTCPNAQRGPPGSLLQPLQQALLHLPSYSPRSRTVRQTANPVLGHGPLDIKSRGIQLPAPRLKDTHPLHSKTESPTSFLRVDLESLSKCVCSSSGPHPELQPSSSSAHLIPCPLGPPTPE